MLKVLNVRTLSVEALSCERESQNPEDPNAVATNTNFTICIIM